MKKFIQLIVLGTIFFVGSGMFSYTLAQDDSSNEPTLTLTEYSDYQCPACGYFHPIVKKLKDHFGDQLKLDLRYFPLNSHQFAMISARAAQAAKNQGKFREMHNMLYDNQNHWSNAMNPAPIFEGYAKKLGLDMDEFRNDLNAAETQQAVMESKEEGVKRGVDSTPTFFIDGEPLDRLPRNYEQFEQLIEQHLQQKESSN